MAEKQIDPMIKFLGIGSLITSKEGKWILLKNQTDRAKYEQLSKNGQELELYGIETKKETKISEDPDVLFAFKE